VNAVEIAQVLEEIARLLAFKGENPFKVRAYRNAARTLRSLDEDLATVIAEGRLQRLPGIGAALATKIEQLAHGGTTPLWERLREEIPPGVVDIAAVPGLGPLRARAVFQTLGIASLEELAAAAESGQLAEVPGIGPKTVRSILPGIDRMRAYSERYMGFVARAAGEILLARLTAHPAVEQAAIAGSLRRCCEVVGDVDLVAASPRPAAVVDAFVAWPTVAHVVERGKSHARVRLSAGLPADLYVAGPAEWPFTLLRATGSNAHWERLRTLAERKKLTLTESGLVPLGRRRSLECDDEAAVYARLGLAGIPPEMREDRGELALAASNALPKLIEHADLRGVIHVHSDWSDGRTDIATLAEAAAGRGLEYLVVCDHSRSAGYAGGLSIQDLARQRSAIAAVNARGGACRVLAGSEVDILPDGSLDYPDKALARLDCVVASIHGRFKLGLEEQTERIVRAIENRWVDVIGHLTGRLLLRRDGYRLDMERVLDAAAEHGVALEINCDPRRMELDWRWHAAALERGIKLTIAPDAHGPESLDYMAEGVAIARKGGVTAADVLNTLPPDQFLAALRRNRG
jgi:DNA polymerase (family 10)